MSLQFNNANNQIHKQTLMRDAGIKFSPLFENYLWQNGKQLYFVSCFLKLSLI